MDQENLWGYRKRLDFIVQAIADHSGNPERGSIEILDVGCGNGSQLSLPLAKLGFKVTGIDPHEPSIRHAEELAQNVPVKFACQQIEEVTTTQDVVVLSEVLEHVSDPERLLNAAVALLKPDGLVIVTTPNGYGEFEIDSWLFRTLHLQTVVNALASNSSSPMASSDNADGHIQFFTRGRLHRIFNACGLEVWRERPASFLAGPFAGHLLARSGRFIEWNARITDVLPMGFASGWYFALRLTKEPAGK